MPSFSYNATMLDDGMTMTYILTTKYKFKIHSLFTGVPTGDAGEGDRWRCTLQGLKTKQICSVCRRDILLLYALSIQNVLEYAIYIQLTQKNYWEGVVSSQTQSPFIHQILR